MFSGKITEDACMLVAGFGGGGRANDKICLKIIL